MDVVTLGTSGGPIWRAVHRLGRPAAGISTAVVEMDGRHLPRRLQLGVGQRMVDAGLKFTSLGGTSSPTSTRAHTIDL